MSLSAINDGSDVLWISTRIPAIASIYYYLHLQNTHTIYCPDDISPTTTSNTTIPVKQGVRELGRNILNVLDSNNRKKLALHFMEPLTNQRRDDVIHFLLKKRPGLRLSHLVLPCPLIQHYYLSGWSYTITPGIDSFWIRQCRATPTQEPDSPSPRSNTYTDMEFKQPFMISSHEFTKKALFVYITQDMIEPPRDIADRNTDDEMDLFKLKDTALRAIHGWIDAISTIPSEHGNTLIFIVDEASLYTGSILQRSSLEERKQILAHGRTQLLEKIRSLAKELPIYLYLNYFSSTPTTMALPGTLAWLQQRHHICIPHSILLTWKLYCFGPEQQTDPDSPSTSIFTQLEQVKLISIAQYDRPKWKTEFIQLLQKIDSVPYTDQRYISPGKLNKDFLTSEISRQCATPLLNDGQQHFIPHVHESSELFDHSVSSLNEQVAHSWITAVQKLQQQEQEQQMDTIGAGDSATENNDTELGENKQNGVANATDKTREEELENLADKLDHDKIRDHIANTGAFSRGEGLLHTLSKTTYSWDDENDLLLVFAEAKGTSDLPYQVYLALNRNDDTKAVRTGLCTCSVGTNGRCKHCVAVMLRFSMNVDDFQQSQEQIVIPTAKQKSVTKEFLRPSNGNKRNSHDVNDSTIATPTPSTESLSSSSLPPQAPSTTTKATSHPVDISTTAAEVIPSEHSPSPIGPSNRNLDSTPADHHFAETIPAMPPSIDTNTDTKPNILSQRRRVLPWDMEQQKPERSKKRQRVTKVSAKTTTKILDAAVSDHKPTTIPNDSTSTHQPPSPSSPVEVEHEKIPEKKSRRRTSTRKKSKAKMVMDSDSDSDSKGDSSGALNKKMAPTRKSTRTKQASTKQTIEDTVMWEDDMDDTNFLSQQPQHQYQTPPSTAPTTFNSSMPMDDDDDQISTTATAHSPSRTMQQSNLSLPMTNLDLLTSKSDLIDDSDTQDEDDLLLSVQLMDRPQHPPLINKDKDKQQKFGATDTQQQQPQQPIVYKPKATQRRSAASDLLDALDL